MTAPLPESAGPALALLDLGDVPAAFAVLDALAKEAPVHVLARGTVQPGRYLILYGGEVEALQLAHAKALAAAEGAAVDHVLLPYAHPVIAPAALDGAIRWPHPGDTLGVVQCESSPSLLHAVDAALKGAYVELIQLRLAEGLGGRGVALLWGETADVEAALELATEAATTHAIAAASSRIIRRADPEVVLAFAANTRFFKDQRG